MAAPNIIGLSTILGKTTAANLSSTSATSVLSNASSSGHCYKINTLNVSNYTTVPVSISINYYTAADLGGSPNPIIANANIPTGTTLTIIDKSTQYYLEENTSLGATANVANGLCVTVSYEDIY